MKAAQLTPRKVTREKKRPKKLTLLQYVDRYFASRDVTPDYEEKLRCCVGSFVDWCGEDLKIADVDCDLVNEWLSALLSTNRSRSTIAGYRRAVRAVWFFAYEAGDNNNPPLRLKKICVRREMGVEAFTHAQIAELLAAAKGLKGFFAENGVRRADFWTAAIHTAYGTGLRRGDLLRVKRSQIGPNGVAIIVMSKTGYRVCVSFSSEAIEAIDRMRADDDDRALPWPLHENAFSRQFRELMKAAGIARGQFKWLRRSCGSYAEAASPGTGHRALGHRTLAVFNESYNDETISVVTAVSPPPIAAESEKRGAV